MPKPKFNAWLLSGILVLSGVGFLAYSEYRQAFGGTIFIPERDQRMAGGTNDGEIYHWVVPNDVNWMYIRLNAGFDNAPEARISMSLVDGPVRAMVTAYLVRGEFHRPWDRNWDSPRFESAGENLMVFPAPKPGTYAFRYDGEISARLQMYIARGNELPEEMYAADVWWVYPDGKAVLRDNADEHFSRTEYYWVNSIGFGLVALAVVVAFVKVRRSRGRAV